MVSKRSRALVPLGVAVLTAACGGGKSGLGGTTYVETPVCDASDPAQVVGAQRILLLTSTQLMNTIRLVSDGAAKLVIDGSLFPVADDLTVRFPPARIEPYQAIVDIDALSPFLNTAQAVGNYVRDNFSAVTACPTPAADDCATDYLDRLAPKLYRRALAADEKTRFTKLYADLRSRTVNGYEVTLSVEEATGYAVYGLLMTPQVLWRWEIGSDPVAANGAVRLTDAELASLVSFFLTDLPPDDVLRAAADAGTLHTNLSAHVDRILASQASRDWLGRLIEVYFFLNQLPLTLIDDSKFPIVAGGSLYADLQTDVRMFLDDVLWNGKVTDLVTSRKAFINTNLAVSVYGVPEPPGATETKFVETMLPADQRSGLLTNPGFLTTRAWSTRVSLSARALGVKALFTCEYSEPHPETAFADPFAVTVRDARVRLGMQTAQEQAAVRLDNPMCSGCHSTFDPYGVALDAYDIVGRYRTADDLGKPVDAHTTLPPILGGGQVSSAVEVADAMARTDAFTNCMAASLLQYALTDTSVELPIPSANQKGCAAAGVAHTVRHSAGRSFPDLIRAVAASPAFGLRQQVQ